MLTCSFHGGIKRTTGYTDPELLRDVLLIISIYISILSDQETIKHVYSYLC